MDTTLPEPTDPQPTGTPGSTAPTEPEARGGGPWPATTGDGTPRRWPVRVGTVVWGLVVMVVGVGLLALAAGAVFDVELAVIALVAAAGVALLAGSLVSAGRRRR